MLTGAITGFLFGLIMGTGEPGGLLGYVFPGISGSVISGVLFHVLGAGRIRELPVTILTGIFGAIILMGIAEYAHRHAFAQAKKNGASARKHS